MLKHYMLKWNWDIHCIAAVTQRVTKGYQIIVRHEFSSSVDGTPIANLTIKQRNQIIHWTIVDFSSMSYLFGNTSAVHDFSNTQLLSQAPQNALLIFDYC